MPWCKVTLSDKDVASGKAIALQKNFSDLFVQHGGLPGVGMFQTKTVIGDVSAPHEYYFSPVAVTIAVELMSDYRAVVCDPPRRSSVRSLVSRTGAPDISFASET